MSESNSGESAREPSAERLDESLRLAREAAERCTLLVRALEQRVVVPLGQQLDALQSSVTDLREAVAKLREAGAQGRPSWLDSVEEAARAAHTALERLAVLDGTQATSLAAVGEDLRAMRTELERVATSLDIGRPKPTSKEGAAEPSTSDRWPVGEPMLEIVRMHLELLRTLVERSVPPVRVNEQSTQVGLQAVGSGGESLLEEGKSKGDDQGGSAARLRTELRAVAASLEHQFSELREEQQRRIETLQRRLEEVQHIVDHAVPHDSGRHPFLVAGLGLLFILGVVLAGLLWHRTETSNAGALQARGGDAASTQVEGERPGEYQRLLSEADIAVAKGEWDSAERALLQASRLRPGALEAQIALAAIQRKPASGLGRESTGGDKQAGTGALSCTLRENQLCCFVAPDREQCAPWQAGVVQSTSTSAPTPTVRSRQRTQRSPAAGPLPALEDDGF